MLLVYKTKSFKSIQALQAPASVEPAPPPGADSLEVAAVANAADAAGVDPPGGRDTVVEWEREADIMRYVALLRGINVGGNNKIPMAALRGLLTERGFSDVESYIASGNVILSSGLPGPGEVAARFEELLREGFRVDTRVLVIPRERFLTIAAAVPPEWANDTERKSDVLFLFPEDDRPEILPTLAPRAEIDHAMYVPGAVLWNVRRADQTRSHLNRIVGTRTYRNLTIRNVNTVRKLAEMLTAR
jgi:uncharacterized protein (DUF1697 family)